MRKIYAIGETVFDIIFKDSKPVEAKAGGSMLNAAVSLGRLGVPVSMITEYSNDNVGNSIDIFLKENGVNTDFVSRFDDGRTPLALAFLDNDKNAKYSFYKLYPKDRLLNGFPEVKKDDIVLFGSLYAIAKEIKDKIFEFITYAKRNNAIIIYDPNYRTTNMLALEEIKPFILESIAIADIVKGSDEDFKHIFGCDNSEKTYDFIKQNNCKNLVYTANKNGVSLHTEKFSMKYDVPKINPISTIAAGDSFNAGLIYAILKNKISNSEINSINTDVWNDIILTAISFATDVCMSYENYISKEFAKKLL